MCECASGVTDGIGKPLRGWRDGLSVRARWSGQVHRHLLSQRIFGVVPRKMFKEAAGVPSLAKLLPNASFPSNTTEGESEAPHRTKHETEPTYEHLAASRLEVEAASKALLTNRVRPIA